MEQPERPYTVDEVREKLNETLVWLGEFREAILQHCDCGPDGGEKIIYRVGWPPPPPPAGLL